MVARVRTVAFEGVDVRPVDAQVQVSGGMPAFTKVGPIAALIRIVACVGLPTIVFGAMLMPIAGIRGAQAASFDCATAARPLEKLICADAKLSKLDEQMAALYKHALTQLSPTGQTILRQGQRDWLVFMRTHCEARIGKSADSFGGDAPRCVDGEYRRRLAQLDTAAQRIGPYLFSRIDRYFLVPSPAGEKSGSRSGFVFAEISIPRIDAPINEDTSTWNAMATEWIRKNSNVGENDGCDLTIKCIAGTDEDLSVDYVIESAQPSFISMSNTAYSYGHGMAHGYTETEQSNFLLKSGRELTEEDLFIAGSKWQQVLTTEGFRTVAAERPDLAATVDDIDSLIEGPNTWNVTVDALIVQIPLWLRYGYLNGSTEVKIPWSKLKPYLRPDLPIALNLD